MVERAARLDQNNMGKIARGGSDPLLRKQEELWGEPAFLLMGT